MSTPRSLFFLLLFLAALAATAAGDAATWLEREHDFGMIDEANGKVACTMRLVNTTDSMLSIIEVRPSCGCTAVRYPRQPIAPADTAATKRGSQLPRKVKSPCPDTKEPM